MKKRWVLGSDGNDVAYGETGNGVLCGGAGNDTLMGDSDVLAGQDHGDDTLYSGFCNYSRSVEGSLTRLLIHQGNSNILVKGWMVNEAVFKEAA